MSLVLRERAIALLLQVLDAKLWEIYAQKPIAKCGLNSRKCASGQEVAIAQPPLWSWVSMRFGWGNLPGLCLSLRLESLSSPG